jgi:hypothetical protein
VYWEGGRGKGEELMPDVSQYPAICLEGVRETTKDPFQHILSSGPTEEGAGIIPVRSEYSVKGIYSMK